MDNVERREMLLKELDVGSHDNESLRFFANMMGMTVPRFVSAYRDIPGFPDPRMPRDGENEALYPVREMAKALLAHVEEQLRNETPLPRGAGAAVPQSGIEPGSIPLMYTEQNFNELAAANTALQSELAGRDAVIAEKDQIIQDLRDRLKDYRHENERHEQAFNRGLKEVDEARKALIREEEAHEHTKLLLNTERLRTERAKGYIDRFLDDEQRIDGPVKMPDRPAPPAPKGPALGDIWDPPAPSRRGSTDAAWDHAMMAQPVRHAEGEYSPRRRY